jgi:hypothetical protein
VEGDRTVNRYILDENHQPVPVADLIEWAQWFELANRTVARTHLDDDVEVSTVFLGNDHNFFGGPPLLFETMVFGGPDDQWQERYSTWDEAEAGHNAVVALLSAGIRLYDAED